MCLYLVESWPGGLSYRDSAALGTVDFPSLTFECNQLSFPRSFLAVFRYIILLLFVSSNPGRAFSGADVDIFYLLELVVAFSESPIWVMQVPTCPRVREKFLRATEG
jgi:hypothetical protein